MTMSEKILSAHAGVALCKPGDILTCAVDFAANHDMYFTVGGQIDYESVSKIDYPERNIILLDHAVPAPTLGDATGAVKARKFAKKHGIKNFFDIGDHAVIHQLLAERGFAAPGRLITCGDSHTCAAGAFNCAARGFGPAEMTYVWCKGETWFQVSQTILYQLKGELPPMVSGKDLFLYIAGVYGDATGYSIEFGGEGVKSLSISQRQSVATMCAEINAEFAIFPCDEVLEEWLEARGDTEINAVHPDADAVYAHVREINLSDIVPYVAKPHFIPDNCVPVTQVQGLKLDQILIGSCSNGRTEDMRDAAEILRGKRVASGTRLIVTPASQRVYLESLRLGYIETLVEAGAVVTNATCGACYGGHLGLIGPGERCLSTTTRNFKGRMGAADSEVMLCAPATAAASAIFGVITDPRDV
ncbi:MAG: aconitase/3-isopropylmalate dehydratase large subunit family protein [Oscillospiraceae bacterium]|nr:aconitase/3-isopropylmalate dehydratase large subunit family protein [Oscillospiraceae bacterium]